MRRLAVVALVLALAPLVAVAACNGRQCVFIPIATGGTNAVPQPSTAPAPAPSGVPRPSSGPSPVPSASPIPSSSAAPIPSPAPSASAAPSPPPVQGTLLWAELGGNALSPIKRSEALGAAIGGKLYVFSGYTYYATDGTRGFNPTRRADVFDPAIQRWTRLADMPKGFTHAGVANDAQNVYFAGGYTENATQSGQNFRTTEAWKYNVASGTWSNLPPLPVTRAAGALALAGRTLHYFGGHERLQNQTCNAGSIPPDKAEHWALNLDDLAAGWVAKAPLLEPRNHLGAVTLGESIYAVGGQRNCDETTQTRRNVERYDAATDTWTAVAPLPAYNGTYGRGHITNSTFVHDGKIVVAGGEYRFVGPIRDVVQYDAATNTWSALTSLPEERYSGVARSIGDALYFATGSKGGFTNTLYRGTFGAGPFVNQ